jgi:putative transposase
MAAADQPPEDHDPLARQEPSIHGPRPMTDGADFCIEALEEAMARHGRPEINTDQGSLFTTPRFTDVLLEAGVKVSMDGKGRWMDNVFIERLWRALKSECVCLNAFETDSETSARICRWITCYNPVPLHPSVYAVEVKRFC